MVRVIEVSGDRLGLSIGGWYCEIEAASIACGSGVVALDERELGLAESFGFGEFACGEVFVELLHELAGADVVDAPEGGEDGFCVLGEEVVA